MKRAVTLVLLLQAITPIGWADTPVAAVQELLNKKFPADKPGAAVLVVQRGQIAMLEGFGLADLEKKTKITPDSAFDLASVSKQFTAMAVMILAERGKLNYDDEVCKWIPELKEFEAPRPIKLRDLLNHTSGIPDYLRVFNGSDDEFAKLANASVPGILANETLIFDPGVKFKYSNSNYALLPLVVERASGKSFRAFLTDHIFVPCGMTSTRVMDRVPYDVNNRVTGYEKKLLASKYTVSQRDGPICGDGNVFSTARDFAKWEEALSQNKLVRAETLALAYTPGKLNDGTNTEYGFGWAVRDKDGKKTVWHSGGWNGTRTFIGRWLGDQCTIVVLCNDETADPDKTANEVLKIFRAQNAAADVSP